MLLRFADGYTSAGRESFFGVDSVPDLEKLTATFDNLAS
jgi:hypothetical protein